MGTALVVVGIVLGLLILVTVAGMFLPKEHTSSRTLRTPQPPEALWSAMTDFPGQTRWRSDLKTVERQPDREGREVWLESYVDSAPIVREVLEAAPPRRLVSRFTDEQGAPVGRWECDITPQDGGSRLTVTEHGTIENPFFRFAGRFFLGHAAFVEQYLLALSVKLGEGSVIERRK